MSVSDEFDPTRVDRYLAGECSAEERETIKGWLDANPREAQTIRAVREAWATQGPARDDWDVETRWVEFARTLERAAVREPRDSHPPLQLSVPRHRPNRWWIAASAGVAAAVLFGIAWIAGVPSFGRRNGSTAFPPLTRVASTGAGQRATLQLADGSRVTVAPGTTLRTRSDFPAGGRDVYLDGEAVFDVVHNADRPFIVHTANVATTVLGTTFGVRRYSDDADVRVAVANGRVALGGTVLDGGDIARLAPESTLSVKHHANVTAMLAWTHGVLAFDAAPLRDVAVQLSRWYGVTVQVRDTSVARVTLTATMRETYTLNAAMHIVSVATGTTVEQHGDTLTIVRTSHPDAVNELPAPAAYAAAYARVGR